METNAQRATGVSPPNIQRKILTQNIGGLTPSALALAKKFPTLLPSQAIGARITAEIKNWYSSQVFTFPASIYYLVRRFGSVEKIF